MGMFSPLSIMTRPFPNYKMIWALLTFVVPITSNAMVQWGTSVLSPSSSSESTPARGTIHLV